MKDRIERKLTVQDILRKIIFAGAGVMGLALGGIGFLGCVAEKPSVTAPAPATTTREAAIPAVDLNVPAPVETATFALG